MFAGQASHNTITLKRAGKNKKIYKIMQRNAKKLERN
jgi:hypothetical protein